MVATQLQAAGESVERLILLDSYPPPPDCPVAAHNGCVSDQIWRDIARGTDLIVPQEGTANLDAAAVSGLAQDQSHLLGAFPLDQLEQLAMVMGNNSRLFATARLGVFQGDIDLFWATRQTPGLQRIVTTPQDWAPFCTGAIRAFPIDAEHHRMVSPAALAQIRCLPLSEPDLERDRLSVAIAADQIP
jgi:thioesterase domain-containing protein